MGLDLDYIDDQTALDEDEKEGLRISTITTRRELDEFEQQNIEHAIAWTLKRKYKKTELFSEDFVRELHRRMYGNVWKWAREFRRSEKNIGVDPTRIGVSLKQLNDDGSYWIENHTYPEEEIAIRYKHSLATIHCFANGNGKHSRLMADIILNHVFSKSVFSWGQSNLGSHTEARSKYMRALRDADKGQIHPLIDFAMGLYKRKII